MRTKEETFKNNPVEMVTLPESLEYRVPMKKLHRWGHQVIPSRSPRWALGWGQEISSGDPILLSRVRGVRTQ
jgi:hypothetical protein